MMRDHDHGNVETPQNISKGSPMEIESKHYVRKTPNMVFFFGSWANKLCIHLLFIFKI